MKRTKSFDAVGFMRMRRDRMSQDMKDMTPKQQIEYIRKLSGLPGGKRRASATSRSRGLTKDKRSRATVTVG